MSYTDSLIIRLNQLGFNLVHAPDIEVYWRVDIKDLTEFANKIWGQGSKEVQIRMVKPLGRDPKGNLYGFEVQYYHK
ncbi:hypothetical protein NCTGTJJY_CDS0125 [Serratia phage 92A1]|nr:hypothetical protein NCTGTJJY_CDS0125 [Serratia phage 92A1]